MAENLFEKAAVFGDIHYGCKNNSKAFNSDCDRFIDWFVAESKKRGCETCIFLGDWNHSRSAVDVRTLNHSTNGIKAISEAFDKVYAIQGNHDLYFRERRDVDSIPHARWLDNVTVISEIAEIGNCALVPWLVDEEWKKVRRVKKARYVFGHFELPHFQMNKKIAMPDHGQLNENDFADSELVFSGHFHSRQNRSNVWYVGSPFGHNYADAGDFDRGCVFLEWGGEPEFVNWEEGPVYIALPLSDLMVGSENLLDERVHCRAFMDMEITHEERSAILEKFRSEYSPRELSFVMPPKEDGEIAAFGDGLKVESVDQIVMSQLDSLEDGGKMDKKILMEIYEGLEQAGAVEAEEAS